MLVVDKEITVLVNGSGDCIEIEDGVVAIGSGGLYAQCKPVPIMKNSCC